MLSDIKLGQYFPGKSIIHNIDPRVKILLTMAIVIMVFIGQNYAALAFLILLAIFIMAISKIPLKMYFKSMKVILFVILFTSVLNLFYGKGNIIFKLGFLNITEGGINNSIFIAARLFTMIFISSALTFTTSPTDLTDALEKILSPLKIFKVKVHELAMMMTIALRFVPTLLEETDKITSAQKARGADPESGSALQRAKALIPILIPLFISSFRRAYELSIAMECRCYQGGENRTRMKVLQIKMNDFIAIALVLMVCSALVACNFIFPAVII